MEPIMCSKCGGPTQIKMLNGPKYKGPIGECTSGCRNPDKPQYALGTFPPKEKKFNGAPTPEMMAVLTRIATALEHIAVSFSLRNDPLEKEARKF